MASQDPQADRFIDHLLEGTKRARELGKQRAAAEVESAPANVEATRILEAAGEGNGVQMLMDDPDPITAVAKFLRRKMLRGL